MSERAWRIGRQAFWEKLWCYTTASLKGSSTRSLAKILARRRVLALDGARGIQRKADLCHAKMKSSVAVSGCSLQARNICKVTS
jgi:hypothetical protein